VLVEGSLPLGLSADTVYAESTFILAEDTQLTLITDGVVEARDRNGELFGFERTSAISAQTAGSIAHAAQQFGQEDDITVVTVTRNAVTQLTKTAPFSSTS
jgi:sigma-B regulation protein RsbU (phosphoserine phosphatase)